MNVKDTFWSIVRAALPLVDYHAWYEAQVITQSGDGRLLDLKPKNAIVPGLQKVPLLLGLPGARVKFKPGARVLLGFADGDPAEPRAALFPGEEAAVVISISAEKIELGGEGLKALLEQVVIGQTPCQFTGAPHHVLGGLSTKVYAKG